MLIARIARDTKVVVPITSQSRCPMNIHDKNPVISSTLYGRMLLMVDHLKRIRMRDQNPVAAAISSSFVGL